MKLLNIVKGLLIEAEFIKDLNAFAKTLSDKREREIFTNDVIPILSNTDQDPASQRRRVIAFQSLLDNTPQNTPEYNNIKKKVEDYNLLPTLKKNKTQIISILNKLFSSLGNLE